MTSLKTPSFKNDHYVEITKRKAKPRPQPYRLYVSCYFLAMMFGAATLVAYVIGCAAKFHFFQNVLVTTAAAPLPAGVPSSSSPQETNAIDGTCDSALSEGWVLNADAEEDRDEQDDDEGASPSGGHLLLDIQGIDRDFLQSADRMKQALFELVEQQGSFDLQYTYSQETEMGNILVGGIANNQHHTWLYGWPQQGTLLLDIFSTDESEDLLSAVTKIENYFVDKRQENNDSSAAAGSFRWVRKSRGFRDMLDEVGVSAQADLQWFPIGTMIDYKKEVASIQTQFQQISVWDVTRSQVEPQQLDRIVFLDGLLQSRKTGDAAYHESLVHPSLFAHPNPKRVAIIGGGEGATLREVLKHKTIEEVVMIEIDEMMVNASRTFLLEWNDCSNIQGSTGNCFDDPRTTLYCEDAFQWFKSRYAPGGTDDSNQERFDVIIMDALDPQGAQEIVEALYTDEVFYQSLFNGLSSDGILVAQVGESTNTDDPFDSFAERHFLSFINGLKRLGFSKIAEYEEADCGFFAPWGFVVASKDTRSLTESFYSNEALVTLKIRQRMIPTVDGTHPLHYFDGATMNKYKYPSKLMEIHHCRNPKTPGPCILGQGFSGEATNTPLTDSLLKDPETVNALCSNAQPPASYFALESMVHSITMDADTENILTASERLCGVDKCRNTAVHDMANIFGLEGAMKRVFIPIHPALACFGRGNVTMGDAEIDDTIRHRQATSILSIAYSMS